MSRVSDLYQKIVAIPNGDKKSQMESIAAILTELDQLDIRQKGSRLTFVSKGRNEYLKLLASRGKHHLKRVDSFARLFQNRLTVPFTGVNGEKLRDFYHDCYYAAFYATRYGLVSKGFYDCSVHKEVPQALTEFARLNPNHSQDADFTKQKLASLKDTRSFSDYVMNTQRLSFYATPTAINNASGDSNSVFITWRVP